ncbi:MAG: NAD(P)/FAD-dependent oxidoreductase [Kangiellaceae bacterium]
MTVNKQEFVDVLIIGAGPSGSLASSLLNKAGINVLVLEKQEFPRFSIGESLLPQLMVFLEDAGMLDVVNQANFQFKNGAAFSKNGQDSEFNFEKKFTKGPGTTFQVKRAEFDKRLADCAIEQGVPIRFKNEVLEIKELESGYQLKVKNDKDEDCQITCNFILDASGFGRVLPRLLDLELPSNFPMRESIFCHIQDNISSTDYDRNKILICVNPLDQEVWYWLIPFSDGTSSIGVVAKPEYLSKIAGDAKEKLFTCIEQEPKLKKLLANAKPINQIQEIKGYSSNVKSLHGKNFALLGNAGEFLDPVFSSGVTIAFKSASLAATLLIKQKSESNICWETEYAKPLMKGVNTFRKFVEAWYDGRLQDIIFYQRSENEVKEMISSILAGYAWDDENPYVSKSERRLDALAKICKA